jgi:hypothetical protein
MTIIIISRNMSQKQKYACYPIDVQLHKYILTYICYIEDV